MASNRASAIFLISLLIFAAANPLAHSTLINGALKGLSVTGQLCCTSSGNCPGQGVAGVVVSLNCTTPFGLVTLGQANTSTNGNFNITASTVPGLILGLPVIPCLVSVQLPLNATICPVLSTTNGVLLSVLQVVGTLLTSAFGLVQTAAASGFVKVIL